MKLSEIFDHLQYGELSNLGLVDKVTGVIPESVYPKILSSVNLGVLDLHKRFVLKKGYLRIKLEEGRTMYPLKSVHQIGNKAPAGTVQFILNDGVKYADDLLKVEKVTTEKGFVLGLNNQSCVRSVSTPQDNVLYVPGQLQRELRPKPEILTVEYRMTSKPLKICEDSFDPLCVNVELPDTHLQALLYFVASRANNPIGFSQSTMHEGNNYNTKYENECIMLDALNFRVDEVAVNHRAGRNGWP